MWTHARLPISSSLLSHPCGLTHACQYLLAYYRIHVDSRTLANIFGYAPHLAFSKTTALMTAWISVERCVCVVFPTKAKVMVTRKLSLAAIVVTFIAGCGPAVLTYSRVGIDWQTDPRDNSTVVLSGLDTTGAPVALVLYGLVYPTVSWLTVTVCTAVLIAKLRRSIRWRHHNTATVQMYGAQGRQMPNKENRLTRVAVAIACVFIVCTLPVTTYGVSVNLAKRYGAAYSLRYLFQVVSIVSLLLSQVNSSLNIVVFTVLGSRFRAALLKMWPGQC